MCNLMRLRCGLLIAKKYPHAVKQMVDCTAGKFTALKLAGVVGSNQELQKISTELPVMIEVYTPYFKKDGEPLTIKYACGERVSINFVLGLPFWKEVGLALDIADSKSRRKALGGQAL